jgi:hypothetical protein
MSHLDIDSEEKEDLKEFLQGSLDSLKIEVAHTDHHAFRDMLKQKERVLQKVLEKLQQGANR